MRGIVLLGASLVGAILFRIGADIGLTAVGWEPTEDSDDGAEFREYQRLKRSGRLADKLKPEPAVMKVVTKTPTGATNTTTESVKP